jgi:hypothetical protein
MATGRWRWALATAGLAALVLGAAPAKTKCAPPGMTVFPDSDTPLPTNGRIVVEAWGTPPVEGRPPWPAMDLRAGAERVPLSLVERYDGARNIIEVVLAPASELRPRTRYALHFTDGGRPAVVLARPVAWTTGAGTDRVPPRWLAAPRADTGESRKAGCGDHTFVPVTAEIEGHDEVRILVELAPVGVTKDRAASYLVPLRDGVVEVGHEACTGPFDLESERRYTVRLTAVDAAGNRAPAPGRPVEITAPRAWDAPPR